MAIFVEISPDPFAQNFADLIEGNSAHVNPNNTLNSNHSGDFDHVRRPVRGIQLKEDTYATIEVRKANGENLPLTDTGSIQTDSSGNPVAESYRYSNFLAQSIQEQREEKTQVILTFGEPFIFFYGEQPRVLQISGVLMNTEDFQWRAEWWQNYDDYLRGTKCVENHARVYLSWDDIVVEGYLLNCQASETSENRNFVMFNFTMFLTNYASVANLLTTRFPGVDTKEFNLDPLSLDTTGEGVGTLESSTLAVRQLALQNEMASKASLMDFVRSGLETLTTVNDAIINVFDQMSQFLGGRVVRVPIGYGGSAVYDDVQMAQGSVAGFGGTTRLVEQLDNRAFYIVGTNDNRWNPTDGKRRGDISLNVDEYLARQPSPSGKALRPADLFAQQKADDSQLESKVKEVFSLWGISTDPPSDLLILAGRATFALMNLAAPAGGGGAGTFFGQIGL